jgi:RND family efflux transporter MFP subunit
MSNLPRSLALAVLSVLAVPSLTVLAGCPSPAATAEHRAVPVKVRTVDKSSGARDARYSGTLEPAARVDIAFRVSGYVESLGARPLEKGDAVKKGQLLARVRSADYAQKVATARAQVAEARSSAKLADQELERSKRLMEKDAVDAAELDSRAAKAESAHAQLDAAIAREREASIALADTVIVAPMDGVVLSRQVEVGTLVSAGMPAFVVADLSSMKVVFGVSQAQVEKLKVGMPLTVDTTSAKVTRIAPAADNSGRVFSVEATLPNADGALRAGSIVSIGLAENAAAQADSLVVPLSAVVRSPSHPENPRNFAVFVLEGDGERAPAHLADVQLGDVLGNDVTVIAGLAQGQRVVTVGATLLRDGDQAVVIR